MNLRMLFCMIAALPAGVVVGMDDASSTPSVSVNGTGNNSELEMKGTESEAGQPNGVESGVKEEVVELEDSEAVPTENNKANDDTTSTKPGKPTVEWRKIMANAPRFLVLGLYGYYGKKVFADKEMSPLMSLVAYLIRTFGKKDDEAALRSFFKKNPKAMYGLFAAEFLVADWATERFGNWQGSVDKMPDSVLGYGYRGCRAVWNKLPCKNKS